MNKIYKKNILFQNGTNKKVWYCISSKINIPDIVLILNDDKKKIFIAVNRDFLIKCSSYFDFLDIQRSFFIDNTSSLIIVKTIDAGLTRDFIFMWYGYNGNFYNDKKIKRDINMYLFSVYLECKFELNFKNTDIIYKQYFIDIWNRQNLPNSYLLDIMNMLLSDGLDDFLLDKFLIPSELSKKLISLIIEIYHPSHILWTTMMYSDDILNKPYVLLCKLRMPYIKVQINNNLTKEYIFSNSK